MSIILLGLDPGFASFGWALMQLDTEASAPAPTDKQTLLGLHAPSPPTAEHLLGMGVIRTKSKDKKVLQRDDDHRRSVEIVRALFGVTRDARPDVICAEALSHVNPGAGSRMPTSTMTKIGRVWGVVDTLTELYEVALLQATPQTIKKACVGRQSATKEEVKAALDTRFHGAVGRALKSIRAKTQHEHPVDALGAIVACLDHDHVRLARAAVARAQRTAAHCLTPSHPPIPRA